MKIAIYGTEINEQSKSTLLTLTNYLSKKKAVISIEANFFNSAKKKLTLKLDSEELSSFEALDTSFDLLISIGGDGTILRAITGVKDSGIPIIGINTGRLGFLSTIKTSAIEEAMDQIFDGNYRISKRSILNVKTTPETANLNIDFALNEIAVSRKNTTSMISIETWLDDEYLTSYWADGLIISTPTGSTGYSLSCGGPIIMPESDSLALTPIAPHNLNARPLVISAKHKIRLKLSGRENEFLISLDSRINSLKKATEITIEKAPYHINMIELQGGSFIETLRKKLLWGVDQRN